MLQPLARIDGPLRPRLAELLATCGPCLPEGEAIASRGLVRVLQSSGSLVWLVVERDRPGTVSISLRVPVMATCSCSGSGVSRCVHVAAALFALLRHDPATRPDRAAAATPAPHAVPPVFRHARASARFFERVGLYAGAAISGPADGGFAPSLEVFWSAARRRPDPADLLRTLETQAAAVARTIEALATWRPPPTPDPTTAYGRVHAFLGDRYLALAKGCVVHETLPGPLDERHPGFVFEYDARARCYRARECVSALLQRPTFYVLRFPEFPSEIPHLQMTPEGARIDAWELFVLRALLTELAEPSAPATLALRADISRPTWERALDHLSGAPDVKVLEWGFGLRPSYGDEWTILAFTRPAPGGGKAKEWKRGKVADLLDLGDEDLRAIARLVMLGERFHPGTPHGHELVRLLAKQRNVMILQGQRSAMRDGTPAALAAEDLTIRFERGPAGELVPRFFAGGWDVPDRALSDRPFGSFLHGDRLVSFFVPPQLRRWTRHACLAQRPVEFPPEAIEQLVDRLEPLLDAKMAHLPKEALGAELEHDPRPALRVEWAPGGEARVEIFVSVRADAPLIHPAFGAVIFTWQDRGRRVFVERDFARETAVALRMKEEIGATLSWELALPLTGGTGSIEDSLALAAWIRENPLGIRIEEKLGKPPAVFSWNEANKTLKVRKAGDWLHLEGTIAFGDVKITLGDILEAARLAKRYYRASDGSYLELSSEVKKNLETLAAASALARTPRLAEDNSVVQVHEAFVEAVAKDAGALFDHGSFDVFAFAHKLHGSDRKPPKPRIEKGELRPYQKEGALWMLRLARWAPGCILADDMGLGKTIQTAAVLLDRGKLGPALILAPASVTSNWMSELARFVPSLAARWYNEDRDVDWKALGKWDVVVVSYNLFQRREERFQETRWSTLVLDETQYLKNLAAQRTRLAQKLSRDFTIALTGTPIENHLGELYSLMFLVFPGLLGDEPTFREQFRRPIEAMKDTVRMHALGRLIAPFLLRRTRAAVLDELPAREEITEKLALSAPEKKAYLALRKAVELEFSKRRRSDEPWAKVRIALLAALTRLRQMACDIRLVDKGFEGPSTKIERCVEIARELASEGNKALVFSQFTSYLDMVVPALEAAGLAVATLTGDTPTTRRKAIIDAFQAGAYDVFCVSLKAGGTGLNLTRASYVIHLDPWWNPAAEEQATSRAHRMGQTAPVTVYRLVANGTIEEAVLAMHAEKRELATAVLEGKGEAREITPQELLALVRFDG